MDPSQRHLKWPITLSQRTPAVGIRTLGICLSFLLLLWLASTVSFGKAIPLRTVLALTFMYSADAGSEELLFRPQWGCPDGIYIRLEWRFLLALTHGVLFGTVPVQSLVLSCPLAPWGCIVSSKLCNSASFHLVTRPPNNGCQDLSNYSLPMFFGGAGKRYTSECVYWEGFLPLKFHLI